MHAVALPGKRSLCSAMRAVSHEYAPGKPVWLDAKKSRGELRTSAMLRRLRDGIRPHVAAEDGDPNLGAFYWYTVDRDHVVASEQPCMGAKAPWNDLSQ